MQATSELKDQVRGEEEDYYTDGTLTGSELETKDGKPITSQKEQQPISKQVDIHTLCPIWPLTKYLNILIMFL